MLGREFRYDVLQAMAPIDETRLQQGLAQLVDAELLYQRGLPPQACYCFKHVLIQEAAYQSLVKRTRQQYHYRLACVLEAQGADTVEVSPELLAYHYTEAGCAEPAYATGSWLDTRPARAPPMRKRCVTYAAASISSTRCQRRPSASSTNLPYAASSVRP